MKTYTAPAAINNVIPNAVKTVSGGRPVGLARTSGFVVIEKITFASTKRQNENAHKYGAELRDWQAFQDPNLSSTWYQSSS
jgi:hypothetical protein